MSDPLSAAQTDRLTAIVGAKYVSTDPDVLGIYGPPLKFDVSLPLSMIAQFATAAARLVAEHAPEAIPVLFGHIGEGNLHLNLVRCVLDTETERASYSAMMALIAKCRGNVSSEHGVGTRKRDYLTM
jgi:FAD/FMN-containing dehydrogenase